MVDEAQRLRARRLRVAGTEGDGRRPGEEQPLGRRRHQGGELGQRIGVAERAVRAVRGEHREQPLDVAARDGHRVAGEQLGDLDEVVGH